MYEKVPCSERLKQAAKIRNMKQVDLCKKTGIKKSAMSQYFKGAFEPKQEGIYLLAKALDVSEAWLMGYDVQIDRTEPCCYSKTNKHRKFKIEKENVKVVDMDRNIVVIDDETRDIIDSLRTNPEMKVLFSVSKKATKDEIVQAVKIIKALRDDK